VDRQRFGRSVRALRQRLGWRQSDLAGRCGLAQATVSRIERGRVEGTPIGPLEGLIVALGGELEVRVRWRGEELDRLLDSAHAAINERIVEMLLAAGWDCAAEVTFCIGREMGSVDVLAWHRPTGRLLVVETKSVVPDLQAMLGSLDRKVRLGPAIAAQRGWRATGVAKAIALAATAANRGRARRFGATLGAVLPQDGRELRRWVADPAGPCPAALWFITDMKVMTAAKRRRIRAGTRQLCQPAIHAQPAGGSAPRGVSERQSGPRQADRAG
jgi:transcriptional regulator with XRE-family HTH domain